MSTMEERLSALTLDQLKVMAEEHNVDVPAPRNKADYVQALTEANVEEEEAMSEEEAAESPRPQDSPGEEVNFVHPEATVDPAEPVADFGLSPGDEGVQVEPSGRLTLEQPETGSNMSESAAAAAEAEPEVEDEEPPIITTQTFVKLSSSLGGDLERYAGHEAAVINAPVYPCTDPNCKKSTVGPHQHQPSNTVFTVRTRDQDSAILLVTREDFEEIAYEGRVGLSTAG
jgi:hypothetical protein